MCCLYLSEAGAKLRRAGRRILVEKDENVLMEIPVHRIERIILIGRTQLTADAMALLLDRDISIVMVTQRGRYRGELVGQHDNAAQLRRRQYLLSLNADYCLDTSRALSEAKVLSSRAVLRRYHANHPEIPLKSHMAELKEFPPLIRRAGNRQSLRGYEGRAAAIYFAAFSEIFKNGALSFSGRNRRPPQDPVNALLSFSYILLTSWLETLIRAVGMEPGIGFYHSDIRKGPVLALDLIEPFRQPICDRFVMYVFHKRMLKPAQFYIQNGACRLKDDARKQFLAQWDNWLHLPQKLSPDKEKLSPLQLLQQQVHVFSRALMLEKLYKPYIMEG